MVVTPKVSRLERDIWWQAVGAFRAGDGVRWECGQIVDRDKLLECLLGIVANQC